MVYFMNENVNIRSCDWYGLNRQQFRNLMDAVKLVLHTRKISSLLKEKIFIDGEEEEFKVCFQDEKQVIPIYKYPKAKKLLEEMAGIWIISKEDFRKYQHALRILGNCTMVVVDEKDFCELNVPKGIKCLCETEMKEVLSFNEESIANIDIAVAQSYPGKFVSNSADHAFVLDGVACTSMDSFLQSLKYRKVSEQVSVCNMNGESAMKIGRAKSAWRLFKKVYWNGKAYKLQSDEFHRLVDRAFEELYWQNSNYRQALLDLRGAKICYGIPEEQLKHAVLSEYEICKRLDMLRYVVGRK